MTPVNEFTTRYSSHGYGINVRETYRHLPLQPFWTWVTGKSLNLAKPRHPDETLLKTWQLFLHISWAYVVLIGGVLLGDKLLKSDLSLWSKVLFSIPLMVLIMNRQRGMLHTFHYTIHGAGIKNRELARFICKWILAIPILHTSWESYKILHIRDHHGKNTFCTDADPDQQFMTKHGFYKGMPERRFWWLIVFAPFHPLRIIDHIRFRLEQSFIVVSHGEKISRLIYWAALITMVANVHMLPAFAIYFLFPIFFITQHSSWLQHVTEHLWFPEKRDDVPPDVYYGALSWGRFLGRPYPINDQGLSRLSKTVAWSMGTVFIDIPLRIYSFMQDMPSHDFHHRSPKVNFWRIAPERAANEGLPSRFGPMAETWGFRESLLVQRDHLCRGVEDPFGLFEWGSKQKIKSD
jgi:hypothetical protein